jgi:NAD(P) transhydrogenase
VDELFRKWGVTIVLGAAADTIARTAAGMLEVSLSTGAKFQPDTVLFAAGRASNTEGLDLDAAGVKVDSRGRIVVDKNFRTPAESVFAAGDVLGPTLASIAMEQGRAAACHALGIRFEGTVDPTPVSAVYGMPKSPVRGSRRNSVGRRALIMRWVVPSSISFRVALSPATAVS